MKRKLLIVSDSVPMGYGEAANPHHCAIQRIRDMGVYPGSVQHEGYAGKQLNDDCATTAGAYALAQKIAAAQPTDVVIALDTNDCYTGGIPKATNLVQKTNLCQAILAALPYTNVYLADAILRTGATDESVANGNGDFLRDFRTNNTMVVANIASPRLKKLYGAKWVKRSDLSADGIHLTDQGSTSWARGLLTDLGWFTTPLTQTFLTTPITISPTVFAGYESDSLSAGALSSWSDTFGGHTITQSTGSLQPTVVANVVNGFPAVHFVNNQTPTKNYMVSSTLTLSNPCMAILVTKPTLISAGAVNDALFDGLSAAATMAAGTDTTPETTIAATTGKFVIASQALSTTAWNIYFGEFNAGSSLGILEKGGAYGIQTTGSLGTTSPNGWTLGALQTGVRGVDTYTAAFYVFNSVALTEANALIEAYIKPKYAI